MKKVAILLDNGFEELEAMGPYALLKRAGASVDFVRLQEQQVTGRWGIQYSPTYFVDQYDFTDIDLLVLPGGPQYDTMKDDPRVLGLVKDFLAHKKLGAICAAPTILGAQGHLKGRHYTCFTAMNQDFGGQYEDCLAIIDGQLATGRSAAASVEFGFACVELLFGSVKAQELKQSVYYE